MSINERGRLSIDYETTQNQQAETKQKMFTLKINFQNLDFYLGLKLVIQDVIYYKKIDMKLFVMRYSS